MYYINFGIMIMDFGVVTGGRQLWPSGFTSTSNLVSTSNHRNMFWYLIESCISCISLLLSKTTSCHINENSCYLMFYYQKVNQYSSIKVFIRMIQAKSLYLWHISKGTSMNISSMSPWSFLCCNYYHSDYSFFRCCYLLYLFFLNETKRFIKFAVNQNVVIFKKIYTAFKEKLKLNAYHEISHQNDIC